MKRYISCANSEIDDGAFDPNPRVRRCRATSTKSEELLEIYAHDPDPIVRENVARNSHTPKSVLLELVEDDVNAVCMALLDNRYLPVEVYEALANSSNEDRRISVALDPWVPQDILRRLVDDPSDDVRYALVDNENLPEELLERLGNDSDHLVRANVAQNQRTPIEILEKLTKDSDDYICKCAQYTLYVLSQD